MQAQELPDGGYTLVTVGVRRIRVARWLPDDPFPQADVVDLDERPGCGDDAELRARAVAAFGEVCDALPPGRPAVPELPAIDEDAEQASYEIAALAPIGPLDAQRVLETEHAGDRLACSPNCSTSTLACSGRRLPAARGNRDSAGYRLAA